MRSKLCLLLTIAFALFATAPAMAVDAWDSTIQGDNNSLTWNALGHGMEQRHDLQYEVSEGAADQDWYRMVQQPYSSYEVVAEGFTGDVKVLLSSTFDFQRVQGDGTVLQNATAVESFNESLAWINGSTASTEFIRVQEPDCDTSCGWAASYTIRAYETTVAIPRFNNSSTQITVLLCQNPTNASFDYTVHFWGTDGSHLGQYPALGGPTLTLDPKETLVLNTSNVMGMSGQTGALTITNTGRYGALVCKSVALEPATGFSFDSPGVVKPM